MIRDAVRGSAQIIEPYHAPGQAVIGLTSPASPALPMVTTPVEVPDRAVERSLVDGRRRGMSLGQTPTYGWPPGASWGVTVHGHTLDCLAENPATTSGRAKALWRPAPWPPMARRTVGTLTSLPSGVVAAHDESLCRQLAADHVHGSVGLVRVPRRRPRQVGPPRPPARRADPGHGPVPGRPGGPAGG